MFNSVVLLINIFGQLVYVSPQLVTTVSQSDVNEHSPLVLKCVADLPNTYESFEWILNADVIATNYTDGRDGVVGQRWRPEAYTATLTPRTRRVVFRLDISNSSRSDTGRWKCRGNSTTSDEKGLAVTVRYKPDSMYPICQLDGTGIIQCTTQEGEPRVNLQWIDFNETPIRAEEVTRDSIIFSTVNADVSLTPPDNKNDSLTCQITQSDGDEVRRCSVSSRDIYSNASVTLSRMVDQLNGFICTVTPSRFSEYLVWEMGTDQLSPEEENLGVNGTRMIFQNIDSKWNGTIIKCVLEWGAWNDTHKIDYLLMDNPTTVLPLTLTNTPEENMKPEIKSTDVPDNEEDIKWPTNRVIPSSERNPSSINPTVYSGREMLFTTDTTDFSTNELMASPEASSASGALFIILVIVILVVILFLTVVLCRWCSKKDAPTSTVI